MIRLSFILTAIVIFSVNVWAIETEEIGAVHCTPVISPSADDEIAIGGDGEVVFPVRQIQGTNVLINDEQEASFGPASFPEGMVAGEIKINLSGWVLLESELSWSLKLKMEHSISSEKQGKQILAKSWQMFGYKAPMISMVKTEGDNIKQVGIYCNYVPSAQ